MSAPGSRKLWLIACWLGLAAAVMGADYMSGPRIRFPIAFLLPVVLGAWYSGRAWGLAFAAGLPILRLLFVMSWNGSSAPVFAGINS
ncbi:MAG: hypothetical protein KJ726_09340, partial [Verrucomicrobia bacterium]|nr:hypothetical protein [Verrucomicrobiota bacterium]